MTVNYSKLIGMSADPAMAENRLEHMLEDAATKRNIESIPESSVPAFLNLISFSRFLYHFMCRHPDAIQNIGKPIETHKQGMHPVSNIDELRMYKYHELLKIAWMDISGIPDYSSVLQFLSSLADLIMNEVFRLVLKNHEREVFDRYLCTFALGKLGANELNFSSDVDLIFVCSNLADVPLDVHEFQETLQAGIRLVSSQLEQRTAEGFLYRVDLKLRPWGQSGPLVMSIDETENYYQASSEAWERFAWLRARVVTGPTVLGNELKGRLHPFIYKRSLSTDDLDRFFEIKNEMAKARRRKGYWNVKVGEGGIRDLEFFIQMLQLVNASAHPGLQVTGTLKVLSGLKAVGLVSDEEASEINHSYLFLRRLENRLQMFDEQQTHELPDETKRRLIIARSLGLNGGSSDEILDNFESALAANRTIAKNYFERVLPDKNI